MDTPGHPPSLDSTALLRGANSEAPGIDPASTTTNRICSTEVLKDLERLLNVKPRQGLKPPSFADVLCSVRNRRSSASSGSYTVKATGEEIDEDGSNNISDSFSQALHSASQDEEKGYSDTTIDANSTLFGEAELKNKTAREDYCTSGDDDSEEEVEEEEDEEEDEDIVALRELLQSREEDLRMAAIIGQRLLDTQEALTVDLEAAREEKWVADCELNALKRDLKQATSRVEQLQDIEHERSRLDLDLTNNGNVDDTAEPEAFRAASWSSLSEIYLHPPVGGSLACARRSSSTATSISTTATAPTLVAAVNQEVATLRQRVQNLETENKALEEKLVEASLEVIAIQRLSVHWRRRRSESVSDKQMPRCRSRPTGDGDVWNYSPRARSNDSDEPGEWNSSGRTTAEGKRLGASDNQPSPRTQRTSNADGGGKIATEGEVEVGSRGEGMMDNSSTSIVSGDGVEREAIEVRMPIAVAETRPEMAAAAATATGEKPEAMAGGNDVVVGCLKRPRQQQQRQQQLLATRDETIKALRAQVIRLREEARGAQNGDPTTSGRPPASSQGFPSGNIERLAPSELLPDGGNHGKGNDGEYIGDDSFRSQVVRNDNTHSANSSGVRSSLGGMDGEEAGRNDGELLRVQVQELSSKLSSAELACSQLHRLYLREQATAMELQRKVRAMHGATQHAAAADAANTDEEEGVVAASIAVGSNMTTGTAGAARMAVGERNVSGGRGGDSRDDDRQSDEFFEWINWLWKLLRSGCGGGGRDMTVSGESQDSQQEGIEDGR